jgi:FkbM family methyltransferase
MSDARVLVGPGRGHRFELPAASFIYRIRNCGALALGRYESTVTAFLVERLRSSNAFFDVGAHTGYYTRIALNVMGPGGSVVAFEPDPDAAVQLRQTFGDRRLTVRSEAAGRDDHDAVLERRTGWPSRIREESIAGSGESTGVAVRVRSLDRLVEPEGLPSPDVLKIDVEGGEVLVLEGMSRILRAHPVLAVECHSMPLLKDVLALLVGCGYDHLEVTRGGDDVGPPTVLAASAT